jgi:hypothetical protein
MTSKRNNLKLILKEKVNMDDKIYTLKMNRVTLDTLMEYMTHIGEAEHAVNEDGDVCFNIKNEDVDIESLDILSCIADEMAELLSTLDNVDVGTRKLNEMKIVGLRQCFSIINKLVRK